MIIIRISKLGIDEDVEVTYTAEAVVTLKNFVGPLDGVNVGLNLGAAVGLLVGRKVRVADGGEDVGLEGLGASVGLGAGEGLRDGVTDGVVDEDFVDLLLGDCDGLVEGSQGRPVLRLVEGAVVGQ